MGFPVLWCLSLYNLYSSFCTRISNFFKKVITAVKRIYTAEHYIFLHNIDYPFLNTEIELVDEYSAKPEWKYVADQYQFFEWYPEGNTTVENSFSSHSLPMLSMEILDGDTMLYDLTDFIENIRVYNSTPNNHTPSIKQIIAAWSLHSKVVLNPTRNFSVQYINENAETVLEEFNRRA
jgi:hypothetical protein